MRDLPMLNNLIVRHPFQKSRNLAYPVVARLYFVITQIAQNAQSSILPFLRLLSPYRVYQIER